MHLFLIRHGESTFNASSRWQGQADPPLSEVGKEQSRRLSRRLASARLDAVVCSDLSRASETARIVAEPHGVGTVTHRGFRELDVGDWAGHTSAEIEQLWPDQWQAYQRGDDPPRGGAETLAQMRSRVDAAFADLLDEARAHDWQRIVLVSHGGVVRAIALSTLGLDHDKGGQPPLAATGNTAVSELSVEGTRVAGMRLLRYNDTTHLVRDADTALDS